MRNISHANAECHHEYAYVFQSNLQPLQDIAASWTESVKSDCPEMTASFVIRDPENVWLGMKDAAEGARLQSLPSRMFVCLFVISYTPQPLEGLGFRLDAHVGFLYLIVQVVAIRVLIVWKHPQHVLSHTL